MPSTKALHTLPFKKRTKISIQSNRDPPLLSASPLFQGKQKRNQLMLKGVKTLDQELKGGNFSAKEKEIE